MDNEALIREKLNEFQVMVAPLDRAAEDLAYARRMLRARIEDEIHELAPALGALSETLHVSSLDLLLAADRVAFVRAAISRSGLTVEEIHRRLTETSSTAHEDLRLLGFGDTM